MKEMCVLSLIVLQFDLLQYHEEDFSSLSCFINF